VGGGLIAVGQMLGVHMFQRMEGVSQASATALSQGSRRFRSCSIWLIFR